MRKGGDCIRERRRKKSESAADLLGARKQAIIWARFNFNKCGFAFRLGRRLWCLPLRRRGGLIYAFSHTFLFPEFYPCPLKMQSSQNHPYQPSSQPKTPALIWDLRGGFRKVLCWYASVLDLNTQVTAQDKHEACVWAFLCVCRSALQHGQKKICTTWVGQWRACLKMCIF